MPLFAALIRPSALTQLPPHHSCPLKVHLIKNCLAFKMPPNSFILDSLTQIVNGTILSLTGLRPLFSSFLPMP